MNSTTITSLPPLNQTNGNISIIISEKDSNEVIKLLIEHRISFSCIHSESQVFPKNSTENNSSAVSPNLGIPYKDEFAESIHQLHNQIITNFSFKIPSIDEVTASLKVSASKFKNTFKLLYKVPYHQYFMEHKMQQARELLESGHYTVKQVSDMLGYTTPIKFVIVFKKYQNITPGKIKVNARNQR